tara:strand:- start:7172 stop:7456 length:285 start_codon:yes stop_codon:yes gene_type:complete
MVGAISSNMARSLNEKLEGVVTQAITKSIGNMWNVEEMKGRLMIQEIESDPEKKSTYFLDGNPILEVYPTSLLAAESGMMATNFTASFKYRFLN